MQSQKRQGKSISKDPSPAPSGPPQQALSQLQAELARIDIMIQREVRRWQLAGQDTADVFRGLYVSDAQANALLDRPVFQNWGQTVDLPAEEAGLWSQALLQAEEQSRALAEAAHARAHLTCLQSLANAFNLDRFEVDALLVCLAPCLDLRYERLYGYLQDDLTRKRPGINLILDLLSPPGPERLLKLERFFNTAPLIRHRLLEFIPDQSPGKLPFIGCALAVNETVFAWLLGEYQPGPELSGRAALFTPRDTPADLLLAGDWLEQAAPILPAADEAVFIFSGPDEAAQEAATRVLAARSGLPLLAVDLRGVADEGSSALPVLELALRDARLFNALPCFTGWDALLQDGRTPPTLLRALCGFPGSLVVCGRAAWQPAGLDRQRRFYAQSFPIPAYSQRRALWTHFLNQPAGLDTQSLDALAGQFALTGGQIRDAAATARDAFAFHTSEQPDSEPGAESLFAAARAHSNPRLGQLAHKLNPRYGWKDIVLSEDALAQLKEIVAAVRGRPKVLDEWGLGRKLVSSRGVTVLFSGQPGTGKTMAAEIIAGELGLDLYKIDLSTIVSKYVGETEKNMERIFSEAESSNAILFFDEADALFGKRSEVKDSHDRYANIEISYLLQRMEIYDGVTILATNLRANLDEAFTRRLQYAVDFPFPGEADRLRIWQTLFPANVPRAAEVDLPLLARRFKLAGGSIRNVIVSAAYLAASDGGSVTMEHLLHGTRREMVKMGRLVGEESYLETGI
jgi:AAA+ superfamily predicted ATPase